MALRKACSIALLAVVALLGAGAFCHAQNLVVNGGFEGLWGPVNSGCDQVDSSVCCVAASWTPWSAMLDPTGGSPTPGNPTFIEMPGDNCTADPGNNYQRILGGLKYIFGRTEGSNMRGGIVQQVNTSPGASYDLELQIKFQSMRGYPGKPIPIQAEAYFGYDLTGQTADPLAETIVWTTRFALDPANAVQEGGIWNQYSRRFTATGSATSIWVRHIVPDDGRGILDVDNISLTPAEGQIITITSGPVATKLSDTSFRIDWTTDVPSTSVVEYGIDPPASDEGLQYASSTSAAGSTTSHSVVLLGLTKAKTYHYRVRSGEAGYKTVYSFDYTFLTPSSARAFFKNGGFEDVDELGNHTLEPWQKFGTCDGLQGPGTWYLGFKANEGSYYLGSAASYDIKNGGVYQRLQAQTGGVYHASFDYKTVNYENYANNNPPPIGVANYEEVQAWLGIDPYGGIDPDSPSVVWAKHYTTGYQFYGTPLTPALWSPPHEPLASLDVTAQADTITLFVKIYNKYAHIWNITAADNVKLTGPPPVAKVVASAGAARAEDNETFLKITTPLVVSLVPQSELGFFYAQDEDGSAGLRVQSSTAVSVGDRVLVEGVLSRNSHGERYVADATVTVSSTGGSSPEPRVAVNKTLGGKGYDEGGSAAAYGLTDQGLLTTITGRLTKYGLDDMSEPVLWLDDGSGVSAGGSDVGVKVIKTNLYLTEDAVGRDFYRITGVVASEIVDGRQIRVLRGREGLFAGDTELLYP